MMLRAPRTRRHTTMTTNAELHAGDELGGNRLESPIGEGGMGVVWSAWHLRLDRPSAIKVIRPELAADPDFRGRFEVEARIAAAIHHPNVVTVYDAGEDGGWLYLAMHFVQGRNLRQILDAEGTLAPERAVALIEQIAAGLDAAHHARLVHRDVKPANILVTEDGQRALITDFGIAKATDSSALTRTGMVVGTLDYAAPEQIEGSVVDARSDVYSLGAVLFEALTGEVPFRRPTAPAQMWAHLHAPAPKPSGVASSLEPFDDVIARAMAKAKDDRYASAQELARAARAGLDGHPTGGDVRVEVRPKRTDLPAVHARPRQVIGVPPARGAARTQVLPSAHAGTPAQGQPGVPPPPAPDRPQAPPPPPPPPRPAARRGGYVAMVAMVAALALVSAGVVAAAVLTRENGSVTPTTSTRSVSRTVTVRTTTTVPGAQTTQTREVLLVPFESADFTADRPADWITEARDEPHDGYVENMWRHPSDSNTSVKIDHTVGVKGTAWSSASEVRAGTKRTPGYTEIAFDATTLAGQPAVRWVFEVDGDRRVDYFVNVCDTGYAVLGSTSPSSFTRHEPTFTAVAESLVQNADACSDG